MVIQKTRMSRLSNQNSEIRPSDKKSKRDIILIHSVTRNNRTKAPTMVEYTVEKDKSVEHSKWLHKEFKTRILTSLIALICLWQMHSNKQKRQQID